MIGISILGHVAIDLKYITHNHTHLLSSLRWRYDLDFVLKRAPRTNGVWGRIDKILICRSMICASNKKLTSSSFNLHPTQSRNKIYLMIDRSEFRQRSGCYNPWYQQNCDFNAFLDADAWGTVFLTFMLRCYSIEHFGNEILDMLGME